MGIRDVVCFYFREDIYYHIKNTILRSITVHKIDFKPIKKSWLPNPAYSSYATNAQ